jgi:hypothetical protein
MRWLSTCCRQSLCKVGPRKRRGGRQNRENSGCPWTRRPTGVYANRAWARSHRKPGGRIRAQAHRVGRARPPGEAACLGRAAPRSWARACTMPGGRGKICQVTITQSEMTKTQSHDPTHRRVCGGSGPVIHRDASPLSIVHCPPGPLKNEKQWTLVLTRAAPAVLSVEFTSSRRDQGR